jgi:hypothetical protein
VAATQLSCQHDVFGSLRQRDSAASAFLQVGEEFLFQHDVLALVLTTTNTTFTIHLMVKRRKLAPAAISGKLRSLRARLKPKPGDKPFAEWWAEYKAEEKALEEAKYRRCVGC